MVFLITGTLLNEEPCCKFLLKTRHSKLLPAINENFKPLLPVKYNTNRLGNV